MSVEVAVVKEHPMLFRGEGVRGIQNGLKTQTRRTRGLEKINKHPDNWEVLGQTIDKDVWRFECKTHLGYELIKCPYGQVGDHLWGRETFISGWPVVDDDLQDCDEDGNELPQKVWYRADQEEFTWLQDNGDMTYNIPWKPSIHMPRWASRILLEITGLRAERLQEIGATDCMREGYFPIVDHPEGYHFIATYNKTDMWNWYHLLWDSINGPGAWDRNEWVWPITFKRIGNVEITQSAPKG